jgi:AbrB family looped-hinge helix DNA binding protein
VAVATLTSKGQVTIPKSVRECLRLSTGDRVEFAVTDNAEAVLRPLPKTVDEVYGRLHKPGQKAVTLEQMDAGVKKRVRAASR